MVKRTRMRRNGTGKKRVSRLKRHIPNYIEKFKGETITRGDNHSWEVTKDGKNKVSLGNLTTAGWFWDGGDGDMVGYLIRIKASKIRKEFLDDVQGKVSFNDLKPVLLKDLQKNDGLYQVSGDNKVWRFGDTPDLEVESVVETFKERHPELTKEQVEKVSEDAWVYTKLDYPEFEKMKGSDYREEMTKIINDSNSFSEFFEYIDEDEFMLDWIMAVEDYRTEDYSRALDEAYKEWKKEKK